MPFQQSPPNDPAPATPPVVARAGHARFDPGLIDTLLRDHDELRHLFARIGAAAKSPDLAAGELRALLIDFKSRLTTHTLTENLRFYDFVFQQVAGDPDLDRMVHSFHAEMNDIENQVIAFVRQYQAHAFNLQDNTGFMSDYAAMGRLLAHRLSTEEDSLYRLYRPR